MSSLNKLWGIAGPNGDDYAKLEEVEKGFELVVFDGAEGAGILLSRDQLLELAFVIYEELG